MNIFDKIAEYTTKREGGNKQETKEHITPLEEKLSQIKENDKVKIIKNNKHIRNTQV
ncbi:MAG: hypothetical protein LBC39_05675 [Methanobrevibacter sp.]|jgi:hypothetical protein|nr:hypothetical protein [Candidatus Methanovirga aequatorialis]